MSLARMSSHGGCVCSQIATIFALALGSDDAGEAVRGGHEESLLLRGWEPAYQLQPEFEEHLRKQHLHLFQRKPTTDADALSAAERAPCVRAMRLPRKRAGENDWCRATVCVRRRRGSDSRTSSISSLMTALFVR